MTILATQQTSRNRSNSHYLTTSEAARLAGCSYMTITRAMDNGDIDGIKTSGGHRRVSVESVCSFFGLPLPAGYAPQNAEAETGKLICGYSRVSTQKQQDNLKRQSERLEQYITTNYSGHDYKVFSEVGSGINNERPQLLKLLDFVLAGRVSVLVVEFGDRLSRSARSLIVSICGKCGCEVIETRTGEKETNAATEQDEMFCDITAIMTVYAAKQHGKRAGDKSRFVASPELKTRIAALHSEGKSQKDICRTVISEGHRCLNTNKVVANWSVWNLLKAHKAELKAAETVAAPKCLSGFIKGYCVVSKAKSVYGAAFYQTYKLYCEKAGFEALNNQTLASALRAMGFEHKREGKGYSVVTGLAIKCNPKASKSRKGWKAFLPDGK